MAVQQAALEDGLLLPILDQQARLVWHCMPGRNDQHRSSPLLIFWPERVQPASSHTRVPRCVKGMSLPQILCCYPIV
jgi:hypothetical protein